MTLDPETAAHPGDVRIRSVLVANRGEIACRVIRTLHELGIRAIAVHSDADADAPHVHAADVAVRLGPAPAAQSYLRIDAVVAAARATGADAVHPGYGFLSENQEFAAALAAAGITFIGPPASAIATMGDKITARAAVGERGVSVVPGLSRPGLTDGELIAAAPQIGFPVLIKPSAGGGGKGMHRVDGPADLPGALASARREAASAFGDDTLFLEHFVDTPRHIEVQVLADTHGNVVHLGERECSLQRRHQKVIEEAPSALLDAATRARIGAAACDAARSVGYVGAGTVEFIVSAAAPESFFFMEMNTRLQVEHPVTELVTGIDLVEQQVRIARGEPLGFTQDDVVLAGHAIEARVYAEDPAAGFLPTGGTVVGLTWPGGGARVDAGIAAGSVVGSDYDPMLAKIIVAGRDRDEALGRLDEALAETSVLGLTTNIDFCRFVLADPRVRAGDLDTALLDSIAGGYPAPAPGPEALTVAALGLLDLGAPDDLWSSALGFRLGAPSPIVTRLTAGGRDYRVSALVTGGEPGRSLAAEVTVTSDDVDDDGGDTAAWTAQVVVTPSPSGRFDTLSPASLLRATHRPGAASRSVSSGGSLRPPRIEASADASGSGAASRSASVEASAGADGSGVVSRSLSVEATAGAGGSGVPTRSVSSGGSLRSPRIEATAGADGTGVASRSVSVEATADAGWSGVPTRSSGVEATAVASGSGVPSRSVSSGGSLRPPRIEATAVASGSGAASRSVSSGGSLRSPRIEATETRIVLTVDGVGRPWSVAAAADGTRWVSSLTGGGTAGTWAIRPRHALRSNRDAAAAHGDLRSPMPGTVVAVPAAEGAQVVANEPIVVVEAMKMEHTLRAPADGVVSIAVSPGDKVDAQQLLAHVAPPVATG